MSTITSTHPTARRSGLSAPQWVGTAVGAAGLLVAALSAVLLLVFGTDGRLTTDRHAVSTGTSALVSESADIEDIASAADVLGRPSLHIATDPGVFIGVGRSRDVEAYLDGVAYDEVTDIESDPFELPADQHAGTRRLAPPAAQGFWVAHGMSRLDWKLRDGDYRIVMTNADGSPAVSTRGRFGVEIPHLPAIAVGVLGLGLLLVLAGGVLVVTGRRP
ncbi:MAG TPA: hypothetical protein VF533_16095 [Solirubrobacteraceae bacterium]|jgi:hypothetical protein